MDSRRIISTDRDSMMYVWLAEGGNLLQTIQGPYKFLAATNNMKFAVSIQIVNGVQTYYQIFYTIDSIVESL